MAKSFKYNHLQEKILDLNRWHSLMFQGPPKCKHVVLVDLSHQAVEATV